MKNTVVKALLTFFSGVLIIKQSIDRGSSRSSIKFYFIDSDVISAIKSAGTFPF